jgi:16S rRNA (guanine527-N7)-methyltransferase
MPLADLVKVTRKNISNVQHNALPNGIICLKGGNLSSEIQLFRKQVEISDISDYFPQPYFDTKKIVYLPIIP